eukprot:gb/GECH01007093.1/.p1 GENE.gb/GECH01007093.1/~~gb/GECH01007093.1/.p1  ORF type:complete len:430 (+),score=113.73 gb/GECH01007093.1/:1-1290(+)
MTENNPQSPTTKKKNSENNNNENRPKAKMESETMYLKTIQSSPRGRKRIATTQENSSKRSKSLGAEDSSVWNPLDTSDIPGAQPNTTRRSWLTTLAQVPDHRYDTRELEGGYPKTLIPQDVKKPNNRIVRNDDIELSYPKNKGFKTNRVVDPLTPDYPLPSYKEEYVPPPPFKRDPLRIDDIEGTRPAKGIYSKPFRRDTLDCSDININTPSKRKTISDPLKTDDITKGKFKTRRVTDPMNPSYKIYTRKFKDTEITPSQSFETVNIEPVNSKPPSKLERIQTHQPYSLRTDDIPHMRRKETHHVDWCFPEHRRQYRKINDLQGIDGASPSGKHSTFKTVSKRVTDPLNPSYQELQYRSNAQFVKPESQHSSKSNESNNHSSTNKKKPRFAYLFESNQSKPTTPLRKSYKKQREQENKAKEVEMVKSLS